MAQWPSLRIISHKKTTAFEANYIKRTSWKRENIVLDYTQLFIYFNLPARFTSDLNNSAVC